MGIHAAERIGVSSLHFTHNLHHHRGNEAHHIAYGFLSGLKEVPLGLGHHLGHLLLMLHHHLVVLSDLVSQRLLKECLHVASLFTHPFQPIFQRLQLCRCLVVRTKQRGGLYSRTNMTLLGLLYLSSLNSWAKKRRLHPFNDRIFVEE